MKVKAYIRCYGLILKALFLFFNLTPKQDFSIDAN